MRRNASRVCLSILLLGGGLGWQTALMAQNLYRCGNTYQDKPCAEKDGKRIGGNRTAPTTPVPTPAVVIDPACIQRGVDAQKIAWAREGGMSEEQMLAKARTPNEKSVVADVYRLRGGSAEIKAMVEAVCQTRLQREAGLLPESKVATERDKVQDQTTDKKQADKANSGKKIEDDKKVESDKVKQCELLRTQFDVLAKAQGGAAQEIAQQRKEFEKNLRNMGC